jgi:hypothetical protein
VRPLALAIQALAMAAIGAGIALAWNPAAGLIIGGLLALFTASGAVNDQRRDRGVRAAEVALEAEREHRMQSEFRGSGR